MSLNAGDRLGPYEVVAAIGAGGMGEVYRARDTRLDRTVAVKLLPPHLSDNEAARQRLEREARAVSSLNHPHICALYDVGHEGGKDFLVMEHLEGEVLTDRLTQGALPTAELLRYAVQIADALDKAHRQGVIHRDLKPGNVMLTPAGAKLLDFGLAKAAMPTASEGSLAASPTMTTPLTVEGTIVGTFQYMSPEQLEGREADARSDIFSFGALLHEMATGSKAFEGQTQAGLIASILKEEPRPISSLAPMAPPALDRLVQTCMAKDPDERRQSMHDVLLELKWIAEAGSQAGVPAPVASRRRSRARLAWATAAVLGLATVVLAVVAVWQAAQPRRVFRAFIPPPKGMTYALTGPRPGPVAISPDGTRLAFVAEDERGDRMLWVRALDSVSGQPLVGTEGAIYPFWSHDGQTVAFFAGNKLKKIDAAGGPALTLCDAVNGKGGSWNADGTILFAPSHDATIQRVAAAGGEPVPVTEFDEERLDNSHRFPWFLPDGEHFLYFARAGSGEQTSSGSAIIVGSLDGEPDRELLKNDYSAIYVSGHLLFARENALMAQPFDADRAETTGDAFPIADQVLQLTGAARGVFDASNNGVLVYLAQGNQTVSDLIWYDADGRQTGTLGDPADYGDVMLSPDGSKVAVSIWVPEQGASDLWIYDVERGIRSRFTFHAGSESNPVWSPDGTRIAYSALRESGRDLFVNSVGGAETERLLLDFKRDVVPTDWSPDGRYIIFESVGDLWAVEASGDGEPFALIESEFFEIAGRLSPDGRWLGYASNETGEMEVYVTSFPEPGRKWQISGDGGFMADWRDDGKEIFYGRDDQLRAVRVDTEGSSIRIGEERIVMEMTGVDDGTISPDGKRLLLEIPRGGREIVPLTLVVNWTADLD